jgi:hypothetical protein
MKYTSAVAKAFPLPFVSRQNLDRSQRGVAVHGVIHPRDVRTARIYKTSVFLYAIHTTDDITVL